MLTVSTWCASVVKSPCDHCQHFAHWEHVMPELTARRRMLVLATVCLAAFAINLDTTIVNVALPDLARELGATTRDLQWIVDGYNLAFAALVLTAGSLGDRFGRRPALLVGLAGFAVSSGIGAAVGSASALVAVRVAVGPVTGGLLLAHFGWPSVFVALVPVAVLALAATWAWVPESSNPSQARLDLPGLVLSSAAIGVLVYTLIEAPDRGWTASATWSGFAAAIVLVGAFVAVERRRLRPMIDLTLFRTPAFSAASASVTVAFFALFGFIFLVTQYFQFLRGFGALSTGVRILPVAITLAIGSVGGVVLAGRIGTRAVVSTGLVLLGSSFAWIAFSPTFIPYDQVVGQMVLMGLGLGLTTAPATESILSVLPPAKAGVGSAVNDATREVGGTLGVAVLGSVFTSLYAHHLPTTSFHVLPSQVVSAAQNSVAAALATVSRAPAGSARQQLLDGVHTSFMSGFHI